ncbi:MAG: 2,3-epoxybenzoyl-CoA dihydrolase [Hyphomicrobiales bacterium]
MRIDFQTDPSRYKHWKIKTEGELATLFIDVDEDAGLFDGYELKLNSYDLGVDIELNDAVQRLRFEHPEVKTVVLRSAKDRVFCAGANIRMLAGSEHSHKVNFCKFTNETRNAMEDASTHSGQKYLCVINGTAAGGGYELALATDKIIMTDDGSAAVSLPELPLLAVLPGTGGLTRVTDKRKVRRDHADVFCTVEEGVKGIRAVDWRLVDEVVRNSELEERVGAVAKEMAASSARAGNGAGITLGPLKREYGDDHVAYSHVELEIERDDRIATLTITSPKDDAPPSVADAHGLGDQFWPLLVARELDDAILHLRNNELDVAVIQLRTIGDPKAVLAHDGFLEENSEHWFINEIIHYWKRVLKRVDLTSRSLFALIEPGSCFAGTLAELIFACDRSYMLIGQFEGDNRQEATLHLSSMNFGPYPMPNGITRLETRFLGEPDSVEAVRGEIGNAITAEDAEDLGLVTFAYDDIDWDDEVRLALEERASFSPDALTGMEANLRFAGPETMETKIFGRLTAWQNWIFQRSNAAGPDGALRRYGTGQRPDFDFNRV